jgi:undecaprenyl pyrophosphate synthase
MWPDFGAPQLAVAIHEFHARDRRFGGLPTQEAV